MSWSEEAEMSVLGAIMLDEIAYDAVTEIGLQADDFFFGSNRLIFKAITELAQKAMMIDVVTIVDKLESNNEIEFIKGAGQSGRAYVSYLPSHVPSYDNVKSYAEIVYEHSRKRKFNALAEQVRIMIEQGDSSAEIQDAVGAELIRISEGSSNKTSFNAGEVFKKSIDGLRERMEGRATNYKTGLTDLDSVLRIEAGRVTMIAGRPGMGKSLLANQIIINSCRAGIPTIMFTMEMSAEEVGNRLLCSVGKVDNRFFLEPLEYKYPTEAQAGLSRALAEAKLWPLEVDEKTSASAEHIRTKIRSFLRKQPAYTEEGKGIVLVDYLGLMKMSESNRVHAIGEISKAMKSLAGELKIPIILLHQLNRGVEQRVDKRPVASDLRDSGELEEDMDHIVMLYRDEVYNEDSPSKGIAELIIRKNRTGQNNVTARVAAQLQYYKFSDLAYGGYND